MIGSEKIDFDNFVFDFVDEDEETRYLKNVIRDELQEEKRDELHELLERGKYDKSGAGAWFVDYITDWDPAMWTSDFKDEVQNLLQPMSVTELEIFHQLVLSCKQTTVTVLGNSNPLVLQGGEFVPLWVAAYKDIWTKYKAVGSTLDEDAVFKEMLAVREPVDVDLKADNTKRAGMKRAGMKQARNLRDWVYASNRGEKRRIEEERKKGGEKRRKKEERKNGEINFRI